MRFDKGNCRKKRVFSQPDVPGLAEGGDFQYKSSIELLLLNLAEMFNRSTSAPLLANPCVCPAYAGHTPKAFQIVQKYKFNFTNQVFGVLFFQRVQVPYERIENPNRQHVASWFIVRYAVKEAKRQKSVPTNRKYIRGIAIRMSIHSNTKSKTVF